MATTAPPGDSDGAGGSKSRAACPRRSQGQLDPDERPGGLQLFPLRGGGDCAWVGGGTAEYGGGWWAHQHWRRSAGAPPGSGGVQWQPLRPGAPRRRRRCGPTSRPCRLPSPDHLGPNGLALGVFLTDHEGCPPRCRPLPPPPNAWPTSALPWLPSGSTTRWTTWRGPSWPSATPTLLGSAVTRPSKP